METIDFEGRASLDHRSLIGRIFIGDHWKSLHTKYISSGRHGFKDEYFKGVFFTL